MVQVQCSELAEKVLRVWAPAYQAHPTCRSLSANVQLQSIAMQCNAMGGMHFVYGASPQHILLHFPIKLLHLPIKFASFPQQIASFPQQFASFPQQIASFPQHSFSLPQHILCHFAKHRIKVFSGISLVVCRF